MVLGLKSKITLGMVVTYTSYIGYISLRTQWEIQQREALYHRKQSTLQSAHPELDQEPSGRFLPLVIHGKFENPFKEYRAQSLFEFFLVRVMEVVELITGGSDDKDGHHHDSRLLHKDIAKLRATLPIYQPDMALYHHPADDGELPELLKRFVFTWLGQSCSILQISGINFLTDPIFQDYLINPYIGPQRITPSPVQIQELPLQSLQYVLISHNHPDHFEDYSIAAINNQAEWIVPMGVGAHLKRKGVYKVIEMSWWDRYEIQPQQVSATKSKWEVVCLPAMHWSGRCIYDNNSTLWCSFLILKDNKPVFYHAGDTGYSESMFDEIKTKYSGVFFGMLPIGQYCPEWHQKPRHISPIESLTISECMGIQKMVGVHWGTFKLSSEHVMEPQQLLHQAAKDLSREKDFKAGEFGKTFVYDLTAFESGTAGGDTEREIRAGKSVLCR
ncbi:hypothetical protein BABINDRAFT_172151 [Babjeviella inositovora NRRL Y-12698]|uniref:Metallo-beta-lactamase domain-containing protein n=1 Tax=Babjeviella inositovora NRRL Y-12698 TaxID=984486 RepID=A0A1E3QMG2_9ASCO|nr:uncharacterized protein BABINDRAFT_172151 [Babjeviella inositovora NRRL Y-12698]ODQ78896.1 hypothetical protein BABINDRAFT_172151 [Babjeviella inositovora NRRL Y-12698]